MDERRIFCVYRLSEPGAADMSGCALMRKFYLAAVAFYDAMG